MTIQDLIDQAERRITDNEVIIERFRDGTMQLHINNVRIPREETIAQHERYIEQEKQLIVSLRDLLTARSEPGL